MTAGDALCAVAGFHAAAELRTAAVAIGGAEGDGWDDDDHGSGASGGGAAECGGLAVFLDTGDDRLL